MNKNRKREANIVWEEINGGALLVDVQSGRRWMVDAASVGLWKLREQHTLLAMHRLASGGVSGARELSVGTGPRRRPSPRGNSGPG
jgi:hypothetical protein